MKQLSAIMAILTVSAASAAASATSTDAIRVNQIGYLTDDIKTAVLMTRNDLVSTDGIAITDVASGETFTPDSVVSVNPWEPMAGCYRIYFSSLSRPGKYTVTSESAISPQFRIGDEIYAGANEIPLRYMRQQRCGYNPSLDAPCHQHDGFLVLSGNRDGEHIDVTGGWHDASDYLQYLTTSANAVYQMLWAYNENPSVWADNYDAAGRTGSNGVPDILDEARWGLEWMMKMNPGKGIYLNQIADDRDHRYAGFPAGDNVDYGKGAGKGRPVYPCSGEPYGLLKNKNRSRGLASSVGKFASSFGFGAEIFSTIDTAFARELMTRSVEAYEVAKANPGACQTAPCVSPYFYEEDNWVDDMELAAAQCYKNTGEKRYKTEAVNYGRQEPVTPWMGADSARHYQWYPFLNLGHVRLARDRETRVSKEFTRNLRSGLQRVKERGADNAFLCGIPFIWCSNNLAVALVTQAMLYRDLTGDNSYLELETAARDWIFGLNPWGKCMIVGLPSDGDYPRDPHSALTNLEKIEVTGGLVDGPVYNSIFSSLQGVHLRNIDRYAPYQNSTVVYHDDYSDYSTNEPTMDGTASTSYFLGRLAAKARKAK